MSAGNDLLERETQAANEADNLNPGQKHSDQTFGGAHDNLDDDRSSSDKQSFDDMMSREFGNNDSYVDSHGDKVKSSYNADDNSDENIKSAREKEESSSSLYNKGPSSTPSGFMGKLAGKKTGPTSGVIGLILFSTVVVGGGSAGLASTLLVNMKEVFHNDRSDASRTNRLYSRAYVANKFKKDANSQPCGEVTIKCKVGAESKESIKILQANGFQIEGTEIDENGNNTGKRVEDDKTLRPNYDASVADPNQNPDDTHDPNSRVIIDKMTTPSGKEARTGKELYDILDKNPSDMRASERAFNSKSSFYLNKFFSKVIGDRWKFSKAKKEFPKSNENGEQDKAIDEQTGSENGRENYDPNAPREERERDYDSSTNEVFDEANEKSKPKGGGGIVGALTQGICTPYRVANGIVTGVKAYQIARLGAFFLFFVQAADEIKDGRGDGDKIAKASSNLTYYEANEKMTRDDDMLGVKEGDPNPRYNLSATDSQGYKTAAHGDTSALTKFAAAYILGGGGQSKLINATNEIKKMYENTAKTTGGALGVDGTGRQMMKRFCRAANNPISQSIVCTQLATAGPFSAVGIGAVCTCLANEILDRILPINPIPGVIDVGCDNAEQAISAIVQKIVKEIMESTAIKEVISETLALFDANSDTKGVDAGNALAAGAGLVLSAAGTGYGNKPASSENDNKEVSEYIAYTQPLEDKYIALEKLDAVENPLDITNKYSIAGTLARSMNISDLTPTSLYGNIATIAGVFPMAFKTVTSGQPVAALYNQPSTAGDGESGRYERCDDEDMASIGAAGDSYCSVVGVVSKNELERASAAASNPDNSLINDLATWMTKKQPETVDSINPGETCVKLDGSDDKNCESSKQTSIEKDGTPVENSQYAKYLQYCTDLRQEPWGSQAEPYEQGSERDQRWYSGEQCMKGKGIGPFTGEDKMVAHFRMWTNFCLQAATRDGWLNCYTEGESATPSSGGNLGAGGDWVIPTSGPCLSGYGQRWGSLHAGMDISPPSGTPIVAPTDIKIISAGDEGDGYGYSVVARAIDGSRYMFRLGHMISQPSVRVGQEVPKGQEIGKVGSTGDSTGPHLHFEIYAPDSPDGAYSSNGQPLDPVSVLKEHGVSPPPCSAN